MPFRGPGLPRAQAAESDRGSVSVIAKAEADNSRKASPAGPFVERRRRSPVSQSWPDALDCLHRYLLGYQKSNEQLRESEERYRAIFESVPIGIFHISPDGRPLVFNLEMARILGYQDYGEAVAAMSSGACAPWFEPQQWEEQDAWDEKGHLRTGIDVQIHGRDGQAKWMRIRVRKVCEGAQLVRYEGTGEDVTSRKQIEIRTEFLAYYDPLTGLPNRTSFNQRFAGVLRDTHARSGRAALFLIEFERFKIINDSLGDQFGDRLLQEIARRIQASAGERNIAARLGGAEFAIILPEVAHTSEVVAAARALVDRLEAEYSFLGHSLNMFCNMGISLFPEHGEECEILLKRADVAMCCAREDGSNTFRIFSEELNQEIQERLRLENGLREALIRNELFLEYQPQVDIRTGAVIGLEALLRWKHQQLGLIPPSKFIGVAENSGLIVPIGEWVLRNACRQARIWQDRGLRSASMAVNVSAVQFRQQGFCEVVRRVLRDTGLSPELLELELTESLMLSDADVMAKVITELRELGVKVAIDDFGTGYSSLGYLKQFKVNRLKIARSFVQDVPVDVDDAAITTAIIKMAKAMNLAVLAEGVENEAQLSFLRSQQCYTIQGFYFSRPTGIDKIDQQLQTGFSHLLPMAQA